jgi:hypothetical protein
METTKTVARVNNVSILMVQNGEKHVPVKPICDALGIDVDGQIQKIRRHEILGSTTCILQVVAADKKDREMVCIPFKYVFGWLFTIQPNMVKEEARDAVIKYQIECYDALFKHFTDQSEFLQQKQIAVEKQLEEVDRIRANFKDIRLRLDEARQLFIKVRSMTFEEWQANNNQLMFDFPPPTLEDDN